MAANYRSIRWTRHKSIYDLAIGAGIALYVGTFVAVASATGSPAQGSDLEILTIGALGACAFFMLHLILAIGPLARLSPMFLPLLYNRRHFGVMFFLVALAHGTYATIWYHGGGVLNPLVSLFVSNPRYAAIGAFPFESLGAYALLIFFLMAATSHDFWLRNLSPIVWKSLHMLVYPAYGSVVLHVLLGAASGRGGSPLYVWTTVAGFALIATLHLAAGVVQFVRDKACERLIAVGWLDVGPAIDIPENCARVVSVCGGDGIAVFRFSGKIAAVSNSCPHQMGPLGEGRVIGDCIVCPWHGRRFSPLSGRALLPLTEGVATYTVRLASGRIFVNPKANARGTCAEPVTIG